MPKYATGSYLVTTFDQYGTKIASAQTANLIAGQRMGADLIARGDAASFVVQRTVHNSLDNAWASKRSPAELDALAQAARTVMGGDHD